MAPTGKRTKLFRSEENVEDKQVDKQIALDKQKNIDKPRGAEDDQKMTLDKQKMNLWFKKSKTNFNVPGILISTMWPPSYKSVYKPLNIVISTKNPGY